MSLLWEASAFLLLCSLPLHGAGGLASSRLLLAPTASPFFNLSFSLSLSLLILILLEVLGVLHASSRSLLWRLFLALDLVLLVVILPYVQITTILRHKLPLPASAARPVAAGPLLLWLWLFYKMGQPFPLLAEESLWHLHSLCLSRAGMIGVSVTAAMSGVGAVSGPASSLSRLLHTVSDEELHSAERKLTSALHVALAHRSRLRELEQLEVTLIERDAAQRKTASMCSGWVLRMKSLWINLLPLLLRSPSYRAARNEVRRCRRVERALLAALHKKLCMVSELLAEQERSRFALTWRGRLYNSLGYIFSVYCVIKMYSAGRSILSQHARLGEDLVTRALRLSLHFLRLSDVDVTFWSQAISLALVGVMIFSSVRGFLVQAYRLRRREGSLRRFLEVKAPGGSTAVASTDIVGYAVAHVMGFYFLSSVLLARASLPQQFRNGISEAVGGNLEYAFYHHWFDSIFLAAACITLAACCWNRGEQQRRRRGSHSDAASRLAQQAVEASARKQELFHRSFAPAASDTLTGGIGRARTPPAPLRNRKEALVGASAEGMLRRYTQLPAESNGQDSASAMVAGATAAAARGTAALLDFVSAQYLALDAEESARI